jgi:hypothetical protein
MTFLVGMANNPTPTIILEFELVMGVQLVPGPTKISTKTKTLFAF